MHFNKIKCRKAEMADMTVRIFSAIFWLLVLFGFDSTAGALMTLFAALIHEAGHLIALFVLGHTDGVPMPRMPGFSIGIHPTLSYKEDVVVSLAGPMANLATVAVLLPMRDAAWEMIAISLLTALSNLLPVKGYDGYRILTALIALTNTERFLGRLPDVLSFGIATAAVLLSLYAIYAFDAGYWIFGVFFIFLLGEVKNSLK